MLSGDAPVPDSPVRAPGVIVAGMHRSGTSLVASIMVAAGWHAPGDLLGATRNNRRGHFEDRRMQGLHRALLASYKADWDLAPRLRELRKQPLSLAPLEKSVEEAVAAVRAGGGPWMWKNPRATLFLEAWGERFPEAQVAICVRAPSAVADSMWRRENRLRVPTGVRFYRIKRTARMLSLWHSYNLIAYRFARAHPDRVTVIRIPDDLPRLAAVTDPPVFDPKLMRSKARRRLRAFSVLAVSSQVLYWRLRRLHDADRLELLLAGPGSAARPGDSTGPEGDSAEPRESPGPGELAAGSGREGSGS